MVSEADVALAIKDILNTNLTDPRFTAGADARSVWTHTDKPLTQATYPRIQIKKAAGTNEIISMGTAYAEWSMAYFNIFFYTKNDFKNTVTINGASTEIKNENLVNYMLEQIKHALKDNQSTSQDLSIDGFKKVGTSPVTYDAETKLHHGYITVRYWFFDLT